MSRSRPSDDQGPLAERGQAFLHRARGLRGLAPHQFARVARRLEEHPPRIRRRGAPLVRAFAAVALLLAAGTAAAWSTGTLERVPGFAALFQWGRARSAARVTPPPPRAIDTAPPAPDLALGLPTAASPVGAERIDAPARGEEPGATPRRAVHATAPSSRVLADRRRAPAASDRPPAPSGEGPESAIVLEGRSFAGALELWRTRRDAPAALAALDEHERRFAHGQMRAEALVLRAEILLAGGRQRDALAVLDRVPVDHVPRSRELRTLRGELRVRFGRCEDGRSDLAPIADGADAAAARAREALAQCR